MTYLILHHLTVQLQNCEEESDIQVACGGTVSLLTADIISIYFLGVLFHQNVILLQAGNRYTTTHFIHNRHQLSKKAGAWQLELHRILYQHHLI